MKSFLSLAIAMTILSSSLASAAGCREQYREEIVDIDYDYVVEQVGFWGGAGAIMAAPMPALGLIAIGIFPTMGIVAGSAIVIAGGYVGTVALMNIKEKQMIKLIDEATAYARGARFAGKNLIKFHKAVLKEYPELTIEDTADFIKDANLDRSLCSGGLISSKAFKKAVLNGSVRVIEVDLE